MKNTITLILILLAFAPIILEWFLNVLAESIDNAKMRSRDRKEAAYKQNIKEF